MEGERILIVESDSRVAELAVIKLSNAGYLVVTAVDGEEAFEKILATPPDVLVINPNIAKKDGYELCSEVRRDSRCKNLPIIILADQNFSEEHFNLLGLSLYDIIVKPFSPKTLLSRVNALLLKAKVLKQINPLTELPGKRSLEDEVNLHIKEEREFDLMFFDLKNFKAFNKFYGYEQGNEVVRLTAEILQDELDNFGLAEAQLFHFGGDDFCVLIKPGYAEDLGKTIIERFDLEIPQLYYETDRHRGGLVVTNRRGLVEQWPIMTIDIALTSNFFRKINSWLEAESIGVELLNYAKLMPGSKFVKDRRNS